MSRLDPTLSRNAGLAVGALLASSATLVCCVLPAVLVALGAGAALAGLVTIAPQLVWLSAHKPLVFGTALGLLTISGIALWHGQSLPCPSDPAAARSCRRLRRVSVVLYGLAVASYAFGAIFAFILPILLS